jgi:hypothetical protein
MKTNRFWKHYSLPNQAPKLQIGVSTKPFTNTTNNSSNLKIDSNGFSTLKIAKEFRKMSQARQTYQLLRKEHNSFILASESRQPSLNPN